MKLWGSLETSFPLWDNLFRQAKKLDQKFEGFVLNESVLTHAYRRSSPLRKVLQESGRPRFKGIKICRKSGQPHFRKMKTEERLGSVKRFGVRYGRKPKLKFSKIETEQRMLHKCPYCSKIAVKRIAAGIWNCRKCGAKFTGKAYSISKSIITKEAPVAEQEPEIALKELEEAEQAAEEA